MMDYSFLHRWLGRLCFASVLILCSFSPHGWAQTSLQFSIIDGRTEALILSLDGTQSSAQNDGIAVEQQFDASQQPQAWQVSLSNTGSEERWLTLHWRAKWHGSEELSDLSYWNGNQEAFRGSGLLNETRTKADWCTLMIQAIYDRETGLALASPPTEILPTFTHRLERGDGGYQLHLEIPLVLDAGASDLFPLEIYRFIPRYGFLDALQLYYEAHPGAFTARSGLDERAAGVGAAYTAWGDRSSEDVRRYGGDWDWCYAPFKRTGDHYGHPQFWDYEPARPILPTERDLSPEAYRAKRLERFQKGAAAGAAMLFFTPSFSFCEEALAKTQYPGAIVYKPSGDYAIYFDRPWVTGHDNELLVYPWGNSLSQQSQTDARELVRENPISGFAYDVLNGGHPFRGAGMKESPRRAFDADGEYVDLSVGIAKMMDFTRELEKDDKKMALVGNPTGNTRAFLVARCDSAMFERPPYQQVMEEMIPLRHAMGHKPITWWDDWRLAGMIDWEEMSPEEIKAAYLGAADYVRLSSYRYGGYPVPRLAKGVPAVVRELPLLKEVITSGWQAVPALRAAEGVLPEAIWPARYGKGLGSWITIGNAGRETWRGEVLIDQDYLGTEVYLFGQVSGEPLRQQTEGRISRFEVEIPAHETLVLRALAELPRQEKEGEMTIAWEDDGATGQLRIEGSFVAKEFTALRVGWEKSSGGEGQEDKVQHFASLYTATATTDLLSFPFYGESERALIVLPPNPSEEEREAAQRTQEYFQFWGKRGLSPARDLTLPIVSAPVSLDEARPLIEVGEHLTKIHREGKRLQVGQSARGSLCETTMHLLSLLDQQYFYSGVFTYGGGREEEAAVIEKMGIGGTILER